MPLVQESPGSKRLQIAFLLLGGCLVINAVIRLVPRWAAWRSGDTSAYAGVLSATVSLLLALVIPLPVLIYRAQQKTRLYRYSLYGMWLFLMAGILIVISLEAKAVS